MSTAVSCSTCPWKPSFANPQVTAQPSNNSSSNTLTSKNNETFVAQEIDAVKISPSILSTHPHVCEKPLIVPQLCCERLINYFNHNPWTPLASFLFSYANLQYLADQLLLIYSPYVPGCKIAQAVYPCGTSRPECCSTQGSSTNVGFQFCGNNYAQPIQANCCGVGAAPPPPHYPTVQNIKLDKNGTYSNTPVTANVVVAVINDQIVPELLDIYESYYERPTAFTNPCIWQEINDRFLQRQRQYATQSVGTAQLYNKYFINRTTNGSLLVFPYPSIVDENVKSKNTRGFSAEELANRKNDRALTCMTSNNYSLTSPANRFLNDYRSSVLCYP